MNAQPAQRCCAAPAGGAALTAVKKNTAKNKKKNPAGVTTRRAPSTKQATGAKFLLPPAPGGLPSCLRGFPLRGDKD